MGTTTHRPDSTRGHAVLAPRLMRALSVLLSGLLVATAIAVAVPTAARAATGDYTIEMTGPATVPVSEPVIYDVTLRAEANTDDPLTGVTLTAVLAAGLAFDSTSLDVGPASPVASFTYAAGTRTVTIVLKDIPNALSSFSFSALPTNRALKSDATVLTSVLSGSASVNGVTPTPSTVQTAVTGDFNYSPAKNASTLGGSSNRLVTYYFNIFTDNYSATSNTFTSSAQRLRDTFPAGTILRQVSTGQGSWTTTATVGEVAAAPWQATWTNTTNYGPSSIGISGSFDTIYLTVEYPENVTFPNGTRPPVNTVELDVLPVGGDAGDPAAWRQNILPERRQASAQGPVMSAASSTPIFGVTKAGQTSAISGNFQNNYTVSASYSDGGSGETLTEWVIEDSARALGNRAFWGHTEIRRLSVQPNPTFQAGNTPYYIEYTYAMLSAPTTDTAWTRVGTGLDGTGTPTVFRGGSGAESIVFNNEGSTRYREFAAWVQEDIPLGSVITGWRVVAATAAEPAPSGSQLLMTALYTSAYRSYVDSSTTDTALRNTARATGTLSGGGALGPTDEAHSVTFLNSANVTTNVSAPTALQVNGNGVYVAGIVNQNTNESHRPAVMKVVLPTGILYNEAVGATPYAASVRGTGQPIPEVGDGVTLTTDVIAGADGPQQVVTFTFDDLPSMRPMGGPSDRFIGTDGFRYNIPVVVLASAYIPGSTTVPVESWAYSTDPAFAGVPARGDASYFRDDTHNFDPDRTVIARTAGTSPLTVAGGLLISKTSSASGGDDSWAPSSVVDPGSIAYWQIQIRNILPNPVDSAVFFDRLPQAGDDNASDFSTTLAGPLTGAPSGATVEYSVDATTPDDGTWTTNFADATAFRVSIPSIPSGQSSLLLVPTSIPAGAGAEATATNDVEATATYAGTASSFTSNDAQVRVAAVPSLELTKKTNGVSVVTAPGPAINPGSRVLWSFELHNSGNTILDEVAVTDTFVAGDGSTGTVAPVSTDSGPLLPGETRTFVASGEAQAGQYHNTATATATAVDAEGVALDVQPDPVVDDSWYFGALAGIEVDKDASVSPDGPWSRSLTVDSGSTVYWRVTVRNTGNSDLTEVTIADPVLGEETVIGDLAVGESATVIFTQREVRESVLNVASGSAVEVTGETTADTGEARATVRGPLAGTGGTDAAGVALVAILLIACGGLGLGLARRRYADRASRMIRASSTGA